MLSHFHFIITALKSAGQIPKIQQTLSFAYDLLSARVQTRPGTALMDLCPSGPLITRLAGGDRKT